MLSFDFKKWGEALSRCKFQDPDLCHLQPGWVLTFSQNNPHIYLYCLHTLCEALSHFSAIIHLSLPHNLGNL